MAQLAQNQYQFSQTALIGMAAETPIDTVTCQINPNTTAVYIAAGCAVKLVANTGPEKIVDVTNSPSDGPVFGVIAYNMRQNVWKANEHVEVHTDLNVLYMKTSAAVNRGARVSVTNPTALATDPTCATDTTVGDYTVGVAETQAAAANALIKVRVKPGVNVAIANTVYSLVSP
jgi:hypothetical protein